MYRLPTPMMAHLCCTASSAGRLSLAAPTTPYRGRSSSCPAPRLLISFTGTGGCRAPPPTPAVEDAAAGAPSVHAGLPSPRPFLREMPELGGRRLLHFLLPEKMVSGSTVDAAAMDAAPTPCPSQMTAACWLVLPLRLAVGHHAPGICVFASARCFFAFPFGLYPKWVMRLSLIGG